MNPQNPTAIEALDSVFEADPSTFIGTAYQALLGRPPDATGAAFYARRIAQGASRLSIIEELARSDEGSAHLAESPEFEAALAKRLGNSPKTSRSLEELLADNDHEFIDHALRLVLRQGIHPRRRLALLLRLRGGAPRTVLLQELAAANGGVSFGQVPGLDELLARMRGGLFPVARTVSELLAYDDEAFVDCAYKTLLGRAPDFAGCSHYLNLLREGYSKTSVLSGLARSTEAQVAKPAVKGIRLWLWRYRVVNLPLLRTLAAWFGMAEIDAPRMRERRLLRLLMMRSHALEAQWIGAIEEVTETGRDLRDAPMPGGLRELETALLARHEALLDIQRDTHDRELGALRRDLARLLQDGTTPQARPLRPTDRLMRQPRRAFKR